MSDWSFVWRLSLPNKLKVFTWRLLKRALPVSSNPIRRRMLVDQICNVCKEHVETEIHTFQDCPFARLVWALSGLPVTVYSQHFTDVWLWISNLKQVLTKDQMALFVCICWCLWYNRNKLVHGELGMD